MLFQIEKSVSYPRIPIRSKHLSNGAFAYAINPSRVNDITLLILAQCWQNTRKIKNITFAFVNSITLFHFTCDIYFNFCSYYKGNIIQQLTFNLKCLYIHQCEIVSEVKGIICSSIVEMLLNCTRKVIKIAYLIVAGTLDTGRRFQV